MALPEELLNVDYYNCQVTLKKLSGGSYCSSRSIELKCIPACSYACRICKKCEMSSDATIHNEKPDEDTYNNIFKFLSVNPTKWSNTFKQFLRKFPTNCLSMFDHFMKLVLKGLSLFLEYKILALVKLKCIQPLTEPVFLLSWSNIVIVFAKMTEFQILPIVTKTILINFIFVNIKVIKLLFSCGKIVLL